MMRLPERLDKNPHYEALRIELEAFLPSVGSKIMTLRGEAGKDLEFARVKADKTIVTKADELAEDLIRAWITEHFPDDAIGGEEREKRQGGARTWIVDPIDGTYNFANFGNQFGISVGLIEHNNPKLGVIFYPAEGIMLSAADNSSVLKNSVPISVQTGKDELNEALIFGSVHPLHLADPRFEKTGKQLIHLLSKVRHQDLGGSFTFDFLNFLENDADALLHAGATPYDIGAMGSIAKELSLTVSDFDGVPLDFSKEKIPIVISKNPKLHTAIVGCLNS